MSSFLVCPAASELARRPRVGLRQLTEQTFRVHAVWRARGPTNPAVEVALEALGNAHR